MENTDKKSMEKIVRSLVGQYGKELYLPENGLRFKGLLFDFASDFSRELKTLKIVLAERIPAKLLTCDGKDDDEKSRTLQHCKDTLVDEVGLVEERVVQVLNILAEGLGWSVKLSDVLEEEEEEEDDDEDDDEEEDDDDDDVTNRLSRSKGLKIRYHAYCKICGASTCEGLEEEDFYENGFDNQWEAIQEMQCLSWMCGEGRHVPQILKIKG